MRPSKDGHLEWVHQTSPHMFSLKGKSRGSHMIGWNNIQFTKYSQCDWGGHPFEHYSKLRASTNLGILGRTLSSSPRTFWGRKIRAGAAALQKILILCTRPKTAIPACPPDFKKNPCPCILEGHLLTNPILSALHLQDPKSNIYVHCRWVNKQLTRISFPKWNRSKTL